MLATGAGGGVVAALAVVDEVGSQLAGDALLLALATDVAGAAPIAERCAAALRSRRWEGDEELALQLEAACGATAAAADVVQIAVDLDLLSDVLEGGLDSAGGRLDVTSGEVWPESVLTDAWPDDEDDVDDDERWLYVEPIGSRPAYLDMTDFIATRNNTDLRAGLEIAVDGRGAFGRSDASWTAGPRTEKTGWRSLKNAATAGHVPGSPGTATNLPIGETRRRQITVRGT